MLCAAAIAFVPFWGSARPVLWLLFAAGLVSAEGLFRWPLVIVALLLSKNWLPIFQHGVTFAPGGLITNLRQAAQFNLARQVEAFTSGTFVLFALVLLFLVGVTNRFFWRQIRWTLRLDPAIKALLWTAGASFATSLMEPDLVPGAVLLASGAMGAALFDGVRTL